MELSLDVHHPLIYHVKFLGDLWAESDLFRFGFLSWEGFSPSHFLQRSLGFLKALKEL